MSIIQLVIALVKNEKVAFLSFFCKYRPPTLPLHDLVACFEFYNYIWWSGVFAAGKTWILSGLNHAWFPLDAHVGGRYNKKENKKTAVASALLPVPVDAVAVAVFSGRRRCRRC